MLQMWIMSLCPKAHNKHICFFLKQAHGIIFLLLIIPHLTCHMFSLLNMIWSQIHQEGRCPVWLPCAYSWQRVIQRNSDSATLNDLQSWQVWSANQLCLASGLLSLRLCLQSLQWQQWLVMSFGTSVENAWKRCVRKELAVLSWFHFWAGVVSSSF